MELHTNTDNVVNLLNKPVMILAKNVLIILIFIKMNKLTFDTKKKNNP